MSDILPVAVAIKTGYKLNNMRSKKEINVDMVMISYKITIGNEFSPCPLNTLYKIGYEPSYKLVNIPRYNLPSQN